MLTEKILNYLEENEGKLLPKIQERNAKFLVENGFDQKSSFFFDNIIFMTHFGNLFKDLLESARSARLGCTV